MNSDDKFRKLKRDAHADTQAAYEEEMGSYKRTRHTSSSDEDEPAHIGFGSGAPSDNVPSSSRDSAPMGGSVAEKLMAKMGHKEGTGLGKSGQGRVEPVGLSTQRGRIGLGHASAKTHSLDLNVTWDESLERKDVEETPRWICASDDARRDVEQGVVGDEWMVVGPKLTTMDNETQFVGPNILKDLQDAKTVFDALPARDIQAARFRANPYETIGAGGFFMNRAAVKVGNLDKVFGNILTREKPETLHKKNPMDGSVGDNIDRDDPNIFYFLDVCSGPGGFSEFTMWRKGFYNTKGFGFTLRGKDDFKTEKFRAASHVFFEPYYGADDTGDITNPENVEALEDFINRGTGGLGVHLTMGDGGFNFAGMENIQELVVKRIYMGQLLSILCTLRDQGNFFCKVFDLFTPYSVGLVFLLYTVFDRISIHKPHTSRPANSERYIIGQGYRREEAKPIREYLRRVNRRMFDLAKEGNDMEILEVVPIDVIKDDEAFMDYIVKSNNNMAQRQTIYLQKYHAFSRNHGLYDKDQGELRDRSIFYWDIPKKDKNVNKAISAPTILGEILRKTRRKNDMFPPSFLADDDLLRKFPLLDIGQHLEGRADKWLQHEEYSCSFFADTSAPKFMLTSYDRVFSFDPKAATGANWTILDDRVFRLPPNSFLLYELVDSYQEAGHGPNTSPLVIYTNSTSSKLEKGDRLVRIFDAGMICDDDISILPYSDRMRAIEKMCKAIERVQCSVREYQKSETYIPHRVVPADHFSVVHLAERLKEAKVKAYQREEHLIIKERGRLLMIRGVRAINILDYHDQWRMTWSKSHCKRYAYPPPNHKIKGSIFENDWHNTGCLSSFWQSAIVPKPKAQALTTDGKEKVSTIGWLWFIKANFSRGGYGPRAVLEMSQHDEGLTLAQLEAIIKKNEEKCNMTLDDRARLHHKRSTVATPAVPAPIESHHSSN